MRGGVCVRGGGCEGCGCMRGGVWVCEGWGVGV